MTKHSISCLQAKVIFFLVSIVFVLISGIQGAETSDKYIVVAGSEDKTPQSEKAGAEEREIAIKQIRGFLGRQGEMTVTEEVPSYRLPFLKKREDKVLVVMHEENIVIPKSKDTELKYSLKMKVLFSPDGYFLRAESLTTMDDPRRMSVEIIEKLMRSRSVSITGNPKKEFNFSSFWNRICSRYPMNRAKEFNLSLVEYKFRDETPKPFLILNVWGMGNVLGIRHPGISEIAKNRIRILYNLEKDKLRADNTL